MNTKNQINHQQKVFQTFKRIYRMTSLFVLLSLFSAANTYADALSSINNLSTFVFAVIRVAGIILTGWGIVQFAQSLPAHDASQRSQGVLTVIGGLLIIFAKEIINTVTA